MVHASIWTHISYWWTSSVLVNGDEHVAIVVLGARADAAPNAECVIQQTRGRGDLLVWGVLQRESPCPLFSTARALAG